MKRISLLLLLMVSITKAHANPVFGEYYECKSDSNDIRDSYIHIVDFGENQLGLQIAFFPTIMSMIVKLDGNQHRTQERITGYEFDYRANLQKNELKIAFANETIPNALGLEQDFILKATENVIKFSVDKKEVRCSRKSQKSKNQNDDLFTTFARKGVPRQPLAKALKAYKFYRPELKNQRYISIADYSQNSIHKRFYVLDLKTKNVFREYVSHGSGKKNGIAHGDPNHDGRLDRCTHNDGTRKNMTRVGFMKTANTYRSTQNFPILISKNKHNAMRLIGLQPSNNDVLSSGVVMHEARYNNSIGNIQGRSFGCPAFPVNKGKELIARIKGGSLVYSYAPQCN